MKFENFTIKAQEAVQQALNKAERGGQQAVGTIHLLLGVLEVGENVTQFLFGKINTKRGARGSAPAARQWGRALFR